MLHYHKFNQLNYIDWKISSTNEKILQEIKNDWEQLDTDYRLSQERINNGYRIKGYVSRNIKTVFGNIKIKRTKYQYYDKHTKKWKTICPIDKYLGIERYQQISTHLKYMILTQISNGNSHQQIVSHFKEDLISKTTICKVIKNAQVQKWVKEAWNQNYQIPKDISEKKYLYLNIDDTFIALRNNEKERKLFRVRLVVAHLGFRDDSNLRKSLLYKRIFYSINEVDSKRKTDLFSDQKIFSAQIFQFLQKAYGDISNKKVIVNGDGARWIKSIARNLNADFVLDKYHITSLIYRCFPTRSKSNRNIYYHCYQYLNSGSSSNLIDYLVFLREINIFKNKRNKINNLIRYIKNNQIAIERYKEDYYIGSQTEAMVSHVVQSLKGYGAKIFHYQTFNNILKLKVAALNQLEPLKVYQNHIEIKKILFSCW